MSLFKRFLFPVAVVSLGSVLAACSAETTDGPTDDGASEDSLTNRENGAADAMFFAAFNAGDYNRIPVLLRQFGGSKAPDRVVELRALTHAWAAAEVVRTPGTNTKEQLAAKANADAMQTLNLLGELRANKRVDPTVSIVDLSLGLSHLAVARIAQQSGNMAAAAASIPKAIAALDEGVKNNPFNSLLPRGAVLANLARDPAGVEKGLNDFVTLFNTCLDEVKPFTRETITSLSADQMLRMENLAGRTGTIRACANSAKAPHNIEGTFLFMGDILAKAGEEGLAVKAYKSAQRVSTYGRWSHRDTLESRIRDAKARVGSYKDGDPANDAMVGPAQSAACGTCHVK